MGIEVVLSKPEISELNSFEKGSLLVPAGIETSNALANDAGVLAFLKTNGVELVDIQGRSLSQLNGGGLFYELKYEIEFPNEKTVEKKSTLAQAEGCIKIESDYFIKVGEKNSGGFFRLLNLEDFTITGAHAASYCMYSEFNITIYPNDKA